MPQRFAFRTQSDEAVSENGTTPQGRSGDPAVDAQDEARMRRALESLGGAARHAPSQPPQPSMPESRNAGFAPGQVRRHRFVQDGEVPVTVVRGRLEHAADTAGPAAAQPVNRLASMQAALTAEQGARERAERALADAVHQIRDLQTKIAHLEMARSEQQAQAKAQTQVQSPARDSRQQALDEQPDYASPDYPPIKALHAPVAEPPKAKRGRPRRVLAVVDEVEPEPVKWWLNTKQKGLADPSDEDDSAA